MEKQEGFAVYSKHKSLSFSAAHFICHEHEREFLHGHNYRVAIEVESNPKLIIIYNRMKLGDTIDPTTGYVGDFKLLEQPLKEICEKLKGRLIVPALSESLKITQDDDSVTMM